jgi:triosephosphate isomerase
MNLQYVANWKMNMPSLQHALLFCHELAKESKEVQQNIIICPSTVDLYALMQHMKTYPMHFGAQDCSAFEKGAYTGQTSAQSLHELKVQYCIVGHSETRSHFNLDNNMVAQKALQLIKNDIHPIFCIGENETALNSQQTFMMLEDQLIPLITVIKTFKSDLKFIHIGYEPVWAIGTGRVPDNAYIEGIFGWLGEFFKQNLPRTTLISLYGGSVDHTSAPQLKLIKGLKGFLIGNASLDFQKFKKIVT